MNKFLIVCVLCLLLAACGMSTEEQWQEQYDLGQQYLLDGDYEQAIVAFTAAIEIDPNAVDAYLGRAEAYIGGDIESASTENLNLALADYDAAIELDETLTEVFVSRGDVHVALGTTEDLEEAVLDYTSAITLDNTNAEVYVSRGDAYMALAGLREDTERNNNMVAAVTDYEAAIALDDSMSEMYLTVAELYVELEDYAGAVNAYTNVIEADSEDVRAYLGRADVYCELAQEEMDSDVTGEGEDGEEGSKLPETAVEYLSNALTDDLAALEKGDNSEDTYINAAEIYVLFEDYDSAAELLEQGTLANPDSEVIAQMMETVEALIEERNYQDYLATICETLGEDRMEALTALMEALDGGVENMAVEPWLGDEFYEFAKNLEEPFLWEQRDGWYIVVYPNGYVYYGEMEDGIRSGTGYGFWEFIDKEFTDWEPHSIDEEFEVYYGTWENDLPNGAGVYSLVSIWDGDASVGSETWSFDINFIDGYIDGRGVFYYSDTEGTVGNCDIEANMGDLEPLYDVFEMKGQPDMMGWWYADIYVDPYYWHDVDFLVCVLGTEW